MANRQLTLGTISFAVCFAAWGLISAFAPRFREAYHLSASQTAFLIAVPVLLGSLARLPMGLLTDRLHGRSVFTALLLFSAIPTLLVTEASSYVALVGTAFLLGMAGSSFAVGVGLFRRGSRKSDKERRWAFTGWGTRGNRWWCFSGRCSRRELGGRTFFASSLRCWRPGRSPF